VRPKDGSDTACGGDGQAARPDSVEVEEMARRVLKDLLNGTETLIGMWQWILDPDITELFGAAGYDFILLDLEHTGRSIESARHCILAASVADIPIIVRVMELQQFLIEQVLDAGAQGVLVPQVETKQQCLDIVRYAKYAPEGERGSGGWSAARWLPGPNTPDHRAKINDRVFVSVIIETPLAMANLEDMLTVDGIDAFMPGPGDLSVRLGTSGTDASVTELIERAHQKIAAAGRIAWAAGGDPVRMRELGARMVCLGSDLQVLGDTSRLRATREALAREGA
jgi:4-hydroxy-2-oxoheptanedioate aldolase